MTRLWLCVTLLLAGCISDTYTFDCGTKVSCADRFVVRLGVAAGVIWETVLRHAPTVATIALIASLVGAAVAASCCGAFAWSVKRVRQNSTDETAANMLLTSSLVFVVAMAVTIIGAIVTLPVTLVGFYNLLSRALHEVVR